ncbi:MAG: hypothetical protein ACE5HA_03330 [Anaerolineae bacterium]
MRKPRRKPKSHLERELDFRVKALGLEAPVHEHRFHPERRWRFDRAWPKVKIAIEVEGGIWSGGRHVRGAGFERDCEKGNAALLLGWQVYRITGNMLGDGRATQLLRALEPMLRP